MKKKYFLRGLGVGILLTALVLCIGYRKQNSADTIIKKAREIGMVFPEKTSDALLSASGSAAEVTTSPTVSPTPEQTTEPTDSPTPAPTETATVKPTPAATQGTKTDSKKDTSGNTRTFTVRGGLLSSSVAREMKQAGIIKDADAFDDYVERSGMARKIRAGKYKIPVGASYAQILKIITRS